MRVVGRHVGRWVLEWVDGWVSACVSGWVGRWDGGRVSCMTGWMHFLVRPVGPWERGGQVGWRVVRG